MATNNTNREAEEKVEVEVALTKTEKFLETNKKPLLYTAIGIVVLVALGLAYNHFIRIPAQKEAIDQTFAAEQNFRNNKFDVALNGDGNVLGFKQIISDYGTKAGEAVYFYAGVCELQLGNYQAAIDYLKKYNGKDVLISTRALANIGDAYVGLNNYKEAVSYFERAAKEADNMLSASYLLKAGMVYEELGETSKALDKYNEIKEKYSQSPEGYVIDKYIGRLTK